MTKNIVLFSDGTNNQGGNGRDTNVWRLYNMLDINNNAKKKSNIKQIAFYDDGVGTNKTTPLKLAGLVCGWGLSKNVRDLYVYLASHYEEEDGKARDAIYLFGFSRGSFTVRMLANLIDFAGLPVGAGLKSKPKQLKDLAKQVLEDYKKHVKQGKGVYSRPEKFTSVRQLTEEQGGNSDEKYPFKKVTIRCMGVWDTVNSTGVPINEIRILIFHQWPWVQDKSIACLPKCVKTGFHALAIDEARKSFSPTLWNEKELDKDQYVEQVWFAGVHSNIGGGYPKDSMARVSLEWMIERLALLPEMEKERQGLDFGSDALYFNSKRELLNAEANANGKLYDSRAGLSAFYRYQPRDIACLCEDASGNEVPMVHQSVFQRIDNATSFYAPFNMRKLRMVENHKPTSIKPIEVDNGDVKPPVYDVNTSDNIGGDSHKDILHSVNARVILYWLFISLTLVAVALPLVGLPYQGIGNKVPALSGLISSLGNVLPDMLSRWVEWYAAHPLVFLALLGILVFQRLVVKKRLESRLSNVASDMWQNLNKELLRKLMGDSKADVSKDLKDKTRNLNGLSAVEQRFMNMERKLSRKEGW